MPGWILLAGLLLIATSAFAGSSAAKLDRAREYFDQAKAQHAALEKTPLSKRTEKDYTELMEAYRRVYFTAPTYGNNTICLMAIAQLAEEAAPRFDKPQYLQRAVDSYEFLLKEYPHSQFRFEALLSIARIYREELNQPAKALEQYERYLKTFPGSAQERAVNEAMALVHDKIRHQPTPAALPALSQNEPEPEVITSKSEAQKSARNNSLAASGKTSRPASISDIRFWQTQDYTRVVLEMGQQVKYEVGRVESPERLYVDLFETRVKPASGKTVSVEDDMLKSIRVAQFNSSTSRVVLDLADQTEFAISELTNPYRLVIDVRGTEQRPRAERAGLAPAPAVAAEAASGRKDQPAPSQGDQETNEIAGATAASESPAKASEPAPDEPAAEKTPEPVEIADAAPDKIKAADPIRGGAHSLTRALGLKIGRILIDPGHGGHDTGTIGPAGYMEKELVLDVSQRLGKLIEDRLGSEVIYTRDDDGFVSLEDRARMANKKQADLFLSIHANSSRAKTAVGIETYYLSLTADPEALEVAARENAVSQETISELQGLVSKIALNEKVDESKEFATKI
ncbi:MAG: N-acetylmuramoyl-L-alanine amidase, partial [Acidobacteria bacterium]|nr:N-acetylmuramoyl-L-alanine amidase [Acidobacteriota bacterium]